MPGQDGKEEEHDDDDFVSGQADIHTLPKAQRTQGFEYYVSFDRHLYFKAEAPTSFEILVKLQLGFVCQRARNTYNNFDKSM